MQKNKLNFLIYGLHRLNPYKTVVSHLKAHNISAEVFINAEALNIKLVTTMSIVHEYYHAYLNNSTSKLSDFWDISK